MIASGGGSPTERARALLEPLQRVISFQGAFLAVRHPERPLFHPLVALGYSNSILEYLHGPQLFRDVERVGLDRQRVPMRLCDSPVHPDEIPAWRERFLPAGFRNAVACCLCRPDGTPLGLLALHTETAAHPTDAVRQLLGTVAPVIANALDPLRSVSTLARMVAGARAGVLLTVGGAALPLPGYQTHPLLAAGSPVLGAAAATLRAPQAHATFLCPDLPRGHVRVTALACPVETPHHLRAVVFVSPPGELYELTRRELEILGLLVDGWSNQRMAVGLYISERTVAAHVEHVLTKLGVPSRTLAAVRALRLGLYVPRSLQGLPKRTGQRPRPAGDVG